MEVMDENQRDVEERKAEEERRRREETEAERKAEEDWIQLCKFLEEMSFESHEVETSDIEGNF